MNPETDTDLTKHNGLRLAAKAKRLEIISSLEKLIEISRALDPEEPVHILGDGTNTIWGTPVINRTVLKMEIPGFEILRENGREALVRIGAGENWDACVARSIELGLSGIEALSGIPGTAGAGPIQNIGAYGREISEILETVSVFDRDFNQTKTLEKSACRLAYRDSIFKHEAKKLVIVDITLCLSKGNPVMPNYADVISYFKNQDIAHPTLEEIREAILNIRSRKLPNPKTIPNCGSFFKNPIVSAGEAFKLRTQFPQMPQYFHQDGVKIPAGWLIDTLGLKGKRFGGIEIYKNNALVLTAPEHNAIIEDVLEARDQITKQVESHFGITLEMEPEIV